MKRIAALAALVITMLAVPAAAAMASTSGPGPGYGQAPRLVQVACPLPRQFHKGHFTFKITVKDRAFLKAFLKAHRNGRPVRLRIICPNIPAKPFTKVCGPQALRFDMAAGSSTLTEVAGPVLAPPQEFSYDGNTYTIMNVNRGAGRFTVFLNGWPFVNHGAAITGGIGLMGCSS
ncbi:MAG: hypothetical protein WBF34_13745 [Streptosporangiaceae bacterium]